MLLTPEQPGALLGINIPHGERKPAGDGASNEGQWGGEHLATTAGCKPLAWQAVHGRISLVLAGFALLGSASCLELLDKLPCQTDP